MLDAGPRKERRDALNHLAPSAGSRSRLPMSIATNLLPGTPRSSPAVGPDLLLVLMLEGLSDGAVTDILMHPAATAAKWW